jgi:hypothetical protein
MTLDVTDSDHRLLHGHQLILPYAMSDSATTFATLSVDDLLAAME